MVRRGHLERVGHGVYRRTASGRPPQQEEVIALLRCGCGARLTGPRLLGHLGVEGFTTGDDFIVLVDARRRVRRAGYDLRPDRHPELHHATYGPVAGTTPGRVLAEMAAERDRSDTRLLSIFDRMRWRGVVDRAQLTEVVADLADHRGAGRGGPGWGARSPPGD